ncbi:TPA: restriction endonuclease subunit S [Escherichia coli]|nr:restriction endonuclease subunit S [Escherichia coli]HAH4685211.1 restriction endonuclease subunit S [Escherichia coli]HCP4798933.1 restriction endonuclease subunit S [Escherichia coli]
MSELTYLEKLLDGVEVGWKTLEDITLRTSNIKWREAIRSYRYIDLTSVDIATKKIIETTEITKNNAPSRAQKLVDENDVIFATTRPTQQRFCLIDSEYAGEVASTGYCILRAKKDQVLPKWILHWISTSDFKKHVEENQSGSAYPAISDSKVKECLIPIPCPDNPEKSLAIQSEIVRILDKFTALTAELTAELTMRKKQYNYYRDQLLSFEGGSVEWKSLGEVAQFKRGTAITQKQTTPGEIPVVANGPIPTYFHSESNRQGETIVIARSGAYAGYVSFWDQPIFLTDAFSVHSDLKIVKPKFIYHVLQNKQEHIHAMKKGAGVPHVRVKEFETYDIPIPPITEQERIVSILDKFDTLTNSITEGLPREIELRQKQYEYYRDLLFSFPKPETVSK